MFRRRSDKLEVLLAHPGGPFHVHKDDGAWTIPKGEAALGEDLLTRAQIEFEEEVGFRPESSHGWIELGSIIQKGGKTVHAWAFDGHRAQPNTRNFQKSIRRASFRKKSPDENLSRRRCLFLTACAPR